MLRAKKRTGWNLSNAFAEELYVSTRGVDVIDPCPLEIPDILLSPPPDPENGRSPRPGNRPFRAEWFALLPLIERPCSAVLIRSRVFTSSSRLRIVMLGYAILPPGASHNKPSSTALATSPNFQTLKNVKVYIPEHPDFRYNREQ